MFTLKSILRLNALSCLCFGALFVLLPANVAGFLSMQPAPDKTLIFLGVILIVNGLHIVWVSAKPTPSKIEILYFSSGDFLWVIATVYFMFATDWIATQQGIIATIVTSLMVGLFGLLQVVKLNQAGKV